MTTFQGVVRRRNPTRRKITIMPWPSPEVLVWFLRRTRSDNRLSFEVDADLSEQLRLAARASRQSPESFATELLARGLEQEILRDQVRAILEGLTPREQEVTWYTARGYTNRQIAETLVVSVETVKTHVRHVLEKLGVHSKADLRLLLLNLGIRWWEGSAADAAELKK
jgi:RNA polymerase sigma factor (sigma-70 family)